MRLNLYARIAVAEVVIFWCELKVLYYKTKVLYYKTKMKLEKEEDYD